MKDNYDFSKGFRDPERARRLRENGYWVRVTRGEGDDMETVERYFVSPEEIAAQNEFRDRNRIQR